MDRTTSIILLESFIDRIERDSDSGKWRLSGPISSQELESLNFAVAELRDHQAFQDIPTRREPMTTRPRVVIKLESLKLEKPEDPEVTLCMDFGTAMSKAFAIRSSTGKPLELALGSRAGVDGSVFAVPSSLFITSNGRLHFGQSAINQSLQDDTPGRKRFDSPKQELSQGTISDLGESPIMQEINPTPVPLTKKDLITMYLAFLTDLASTELNERHGASRYVVRRFARPCWDEKRTTWAERELKDMLAAAQIIADTFHGEWAEGINVTQVRNVLDQVKGQALPSCLISNGVAEPIAAAASRVIQGKAQRRPYMIIDIGAGTTDFGLFVVRENPKEEWIRAFQIGNGIRGVRRAGDTIDSILREEIIRRHGIPTGLDDPIRKRIIANLDLRIRTYKETLFRRGMVEYVLNDDSKGSLTVAEFLDLPGTKRFSELLEQEFRSILDAIDSSWIKSVIAPAGLTVILTGGGSNLPMVEPLAEGFIESQRANIVRSRGPALPQWIEEDHQEFTDEYPQLAVAMGGASPDLPEMMKPVMEFGGLANRTVMPGNLQISGT
ncbi:MAG: hypothetical protein WD688_16960 [Candidatus Binatia bacterium]